VLLAHGIQDTAILEYLVGTWGLPRTEATLALAAARVLADALDALTALPPEPNGTNAPEASRVTVAYHLHGLYSHVVRSTLKPWGIRSCRTGCG
jgi:hypothetical protein